MTTNSLGNPQALAQQLMDAANSLSDQEASQRYQQILTQLPPDQATKLNALALSQVGHSERRTLATQFRQAKNDPASAFDDYNDDDDDDDVAANAMTLGRMTARAQQQDPALLGGMLGGQQSGIGGQIGKAALAALAAMLIRKMMNGQGGQSQGLPQRGDQQMPGGLDIGSILGGLLGSGAMGGMPGGGTGGGQQMPGGLDVGSILGGLLGGGATGGPSQGLPQRGQQMPSSQGMPGGLDIGSILGGVLGGGATQQPQGGLGSILGSILGGGAGGADDTPTPGTSPRGGSHRR